MNHPTPTDDLEAFFTTAEKDKIDHIIELLERLVAAAELKRPRRTAATFDLPQAKAWIVETLKEVGPQTRGSINSRMPYSRRDFVDPALKELIAENAVCRVEPKPGKKGPRNPRYATTDQAQLMAEQQAELDQRDQRIEAERAKAEQHAAAAARFSPVALDRVGSHLMTIISEAGGSMPRKVLISRSSNETELDLWATSLDEFIRLGRIEERDGQLFVTA